MKQHIEGSKPHDKSLTCVGMAMGVGCAAVLMTGCAELMAPGGFAEEAYPLKERTIPSYKAWDIQFTANVTADFNFDWTVEAGKEVNVYVMTRNQDGRASAGLVTEDTLEPGRDCIRCEKGIVGQGAVAVHLDPGEYDVVFYNNGGSPVDVQSHATARRD